MTLVHFAVAQHIETTMFILLKKCLAFFNSPGNGVTQRENRKTPSATGETNTLSLNMYKYLGTLKSNSHLYQI